MRTFEQQIADELQELQAAGLWRQLRPVQGIEGPTMNEAGEERVAFASNDYLGLACHPALRAAAREAAERWGAGSSASRLITGSLLPHVELEELLAQWKRTEAALTFASGYATALGTIPALVGRDDVVILDKRVHACCVDGARLSGARLRVFRHNDLEDLAAKLQWADTQRASSRSAAHRPSRILILTESVFSMDGDLAPLREIVELKDRFGAWLMLDEAHAVGMFGERRSGLAEAFELAARVEIQMGTLGKALGSAGGYIAGSRALIDLLINRARSFLFSTAPVPAQAAAARAAIELVNGSEGQQRNQRLWALVDLLKNELIRVGWASGVIRTPIVPLIVGSENAAVDLAQFLANRGLWVPAIRYPTVARGAARLRLSLSAGHSPAHLHQLAAALQSAGPAPRLLADEGTEAVPTDDLS